MPINFPITERMIADFCRKRLAPHLLPSAPETFSAKAAAPLRKCEEQLHCCIGPWSMSAVSGSQRRSRKGLHLRYCVAVERFHVHDNLFEDTLNRSLEFLLTRAEFEEEQQYILTLNVDGIAHATEEVWYEDLLRSVVASFTKAARFLNTNYQEIR